MGSVPATGKMFRNILLLLLVLKVAKIAGAQRNYNASPDYESINRVTSVYGRNAILQCPFDKSKNFATAWMRRQNGRTILIGRQNMKFITSDRYSILHKEGANDLTIYNVTENDIGEYICQINTEPMKNYVRIFSIVNYIFFLIIFIFSFLF